MPTFLFAGDTIATGSEKCTTHSGLVKPRPPRPEGRPRRGRGVAAKQLRLASGASNGPPQAGPSPRRPQQGRHGPTAAGRGGRGQQKVATAPLPHSAATRWGRGATPAGRTRPTNGGIAKRSRTAPERSGGLPAGGAATQPSGRSPGTVFATVDVQGARLPAAKRSGATAGSRLTAGETLHASTAHAERSERAVPGPAGGRSLAPAGGQAGRGLQSCR